MAYEVEIEVSANSVYEVNIEVSESIPSGSIATNSITLTNINGTSITDSRLIGRTVTFLAYDNTINTIDFTQTGDTITLTYGSFFNSTVIINLQ